MSQTEQQLLLEPSTGLTECASVVQMQVQIRQGATNGCHLLQHRPRQSDGDHGADLRRPRAGYHHPQGAGSVVMISLDDYQAREETASLLHSPKNALRLLESIAELES